MYFVRYSSKDNLWTVGFLISSNSETLADEWQAVRDFASEKQAFAFINYLNGGSGDFFD
jgi:hypothetical protein